MTCKTAVELVYIVPRERLFGGKPIPQGFHTQGLKQLMLRIYRYGKFLKRSLVENNPTLKQIIPYTLICLKSQFLLLHRKGTQTEKRLHHKYSLGVGGHINPVTIAPTQGGNREKLIIETGLKRELAEELLITCNYTYELIGYLNDDSNPVGQVHFGLIYQIEVTNKRKVSIAEKDLMSGRFLTATQMRKYYPLMETWSQIIYDQWLG